MRRSAVEPEPLHSGSQGRGLIHPPDFSPAQVEFWRRVCGARPHSLARFVLSRFLTAPSAKPRHVRMYRCRRRRGRPPQHHEIPTRRRPPTLDQRSSRTTMEWPEMARISSSDAPASADACSADPLSYIASMAQQPCDGRCHRLNRLRQSNPKWLAPSPRVHRYGTACAAYASICADRHHRGSAPWRNLW